MFHTCTPGFLTFSGGIEMERWANMGLQKIFKITNEDIKPSEEWRQRYLSRLSCRFVMLQFLLLTLSIFLHSEGI